MDQRWIQLCLTYIVPLALSTVHSASGNVSYLEIAVGGTNLVKVYNGGTTKIDLVYEDGTPTNLTAHLDTGTYLPTDEAYINHNEKTIQFPVHSKDITDNFGTYLLTFTLHLEEGSMAIKELVIFHEEPIVEFKVTGSRFIPLLEEIHFTISLQNGSNVETEWFLDTNDTCLLRHDGTPKMLHLPFTFVVPGTHNVTVVAANTVSRTFDSMLVTAVYKINRLTVEVDRLLSYGKVVVLRLRLREEANQPMGNLTMSCDYGDATEQTEVNLNDKLSKLLGPRGFVQSHKYRSFGPYRIKMKITSEVDEKEFILNYEAEDTAEERTTGLKLGKDTGIYIKVSKNGIPDLELVYTKEVFISLQADQTKENVFSTANAAFDKQNEVVEFPLNGDEPTTVDGNFNMTLTLQTDPGDKQIVEVSVIYETRLNNTKTINKSTELALGDTFTILPVIQSDSLLRWELGSHDDLEDVDSEDKIPIPSIKLNFPRAGLYCMTVESQNTIKALRETYFFKVINSLGNFRISVLSPQSLPNVPVKFQLSIVETNNDLSGMVKTEIAYGDGNTEIFNVNITVKEGVGSQEIHSFQHIYKFAGDFSLRVILSTADGRSIVSHDIRILPVKHCVQTTEPRLDLYEDTSSFVSICSGCTSTLKLRYCGIHDVSVTGSINTGTILSTCGVLIDEVKQTIIFPVYSHDLEADGFGTYLLTLTVLSKNGRQAKKEMVLFHEEAIKGFKVKHDVGYVTQNKETFFDVYLDSGSNLETEWFLDTSNTYLLKHKGSPRHIRQNFTLTALGTHNITIIAANSITRTVDFLQIQVIRTLESFTMEVVNDDHLTSLPVYFKLKTSEEDLDHFGELILHMDYGDSQEILIMCNEEEPCFPCFERQHAYKSPGKYSVKAMLSNADGNNIKTFYMEVVVKDKIDIDDEEEDDDNINILFVVAISCVLVLGILSFVAFVLGGRKIVSERCRNRLLRRQEKYEKFVNESDEKMTEKI